MNNGDRQRLMHIRRYCLDIAEFIERFGEDYDTFVQDRAFTNAVSMCVLQIGELANGLSAEYREETKTEMPWGMIRGMRNWIAHAYADMDESVIWETATNDIPSLKRFCDRALQANHIKKETAKAPLSQEQPIKRKSSRSRDDFER